MHALEDRIQLELPALGDELRQALSKTEQSGNERAAVRERAMEDRIHREIESVRAGIERVDRHVYWLLALASAVAVLALVRC